MTTPETMPTLPFAVFDEFGRGADDRVQDYAYSYARSHAAALEKEVQALREALEAIRPWAELEGLRRTARHGADLAKARAALAARAQETP